MTISKSNFKPLIDWLVKTAKETVNLISQQYEKSRQEQFAMQQSNRLEICRQAGQQIHPELAYIFRQTNISTRLQPIRYPNDLLPYDYTSRPDYSPRFYFLWTKTNPQVIAQTTLDVMKEKMNLAIRSTFNRYRLVYQQMNDYEKSEFLWNYPSCNYGFHITDCQDIGDEIRIEVALGFPT